MAEKKQVKKEQPDMKASGYKDNPDKPHPDSVAQVQVVGK